MLGNPVRSNIGTRCGAVQMDKLVFVDAINLRVPILHELEYVSAYIDLAMQGGLPCQGAQRRRIPSVVTIERHACRIRHSTEDNANLPDRLERSQFPEVN
jgi:hypothetical protein